MPPIKYDKWPIIFCFLSGTLLIGATYNSFILSGGKATLLRTAVSIGSIVIYTLVGWLVAIRYTGIFMYREVTHPVKPHELLPQNTYWINGKTEAIFVGVMDHTGKYLFHINGLNKKNNRLDTKALTPDQVRKYISTEKEI